MAVDGPDSTHVVSPSSSVWAAESSELALTLETVDPEVLVRFSGSLPVVGGDVRLGVGRFIERRKSR